MAVWERAARYAYMAALAEMMDLSRFWRRDEGLDRLMAEAETIVFGCACGAGGKWRPRKLENIFNRFGAAEPATDTFYETEQLRTALPRALAAAEREGDATGAADFLRKKFAKQPPAQRSLGDLARLTEIAGDGFAAYPEAEGMGDISLYERAFLTAAVAACLTGYAEERGTEDFASLRREEAFLLAAGDISGIQAFLYTIPSKGALKSLRGRSVYLDILLEHAADEILTQAELSRSNLLYTGGGHFYLLLPNVARCRAVLEKFSASVNDWFLRRTGGRLYLAMAWTLCSGSEFMDGAGAPFRRAGRELSRQKLSRYTDGQLRVMFDSESDLNRAKGGLRECGICHVSTNDLAPYQSAGENDTLACDFCRNLYRLGEELLTADALAVRRVRYEGAVPLPGSEGELFLQAVELENLRKSATDDVVRIYVKNRVYADEPRTVYVWLADYSLQSDSWGAADFSELMDIAAREDTAGIRRLGVMRADVDNLGAAFIAGFPKKLATLSRVSALSRRLSLFFKRYVPLVCERKLDVERFLLFDDRSAEQKRRSVHIVYAGGDDMFLAGAWEDMIELAVEIRRAFQVYTNGKLTFSAGIGLFTEKYPVSLLAREAGELEDAAKKRPEKDGIALFGASTETLGESAALEAVCFSWREFENDVVGEKLAFLQENIAFGEAGAGDERKLVAGKRTRYKLLELLEPKETLDLDLARLAYTLARLEPKREKEQRREAYQKVREKFYDWAKNDGDRRALRAAVELTIYHGRNGKEAANDA